MNCREFREIADTYLSDELLVETNHDVHQHLEHCIDCRNELASRRDVRAKLRSAVMNDESAAIDPIFANKLRISLREQSKGKASFSFRNLGLAFASVAVLLLSTISIINYLKSDNDLASWRKLSEEAIVTHKECAIGHRNDWIESEKVSTPEKIKFQNSILDPLKVKYGEDLQVIDMHECEFYGKTYRHYVLRSDEHTISLIQNETDSSAGTKTFLEAGKIISEPRGGYQLASFTANGNGNPVFIVSDLTEAENLTLARSVRNSPSI
jgi:hypothetical protein